MKFGIQLKILIICAAVAFVPITIALVYSTNTFTSNMKEDVSGLAASAAKETAEKFFIELESIGASVRESSVALERLSPAEWDHALDLLRNSYTIVVGVADRSGNVVAAVAAGGGGAGGSASGSWASVANEEWFREALAGKSYRYSEDASDTVYYSAPFVGTVGAVGTDGKAQAGGKSILMAAADRFRGADGGDYFVFAVYDLYRLTQDRVLTVLDSRYGDVGSNIFTPTDGGNFIWSDTNAARSGTFINASSFGEAWSFYASLRKERAGSLSELAPKSAEYTLNGQGRIVGVVMAPSWYPYELGFFGYLTNPEKAYALIQGEVYNMAMAAIAVAAVGLVVSSFTARGMTRRLAVLAAAAERVKEGDLRVGADFDFGLGGGADKDKDKDKDNISGSGSGSGSDKGSGKGRRDGDEIDQLARGFRAMLGSLRELIGGVTSTSAKVASSAEVLASSSEELSSSAKQIAQSIQQISSGLQTHSQSVNSIADEARRLKEANDAVSKSAEEMLGRAKEMHANVDSAKKEGREAGESLAELLKSAKTAGEVTERLKDAMSQISSLVGTIKEIADQTSLLALNASIEAARAGEAGRGFNVVAGEIRKLAEEAGTSAEKAKSVIDGAVKSAEDAIAAVAEMKAKVDSGKKEVSEALEALDRLLGSVNRFAEVAESVGARVREASGAFGRIERSISEMAAAAEESAASSEEITSASEEQASAVEKLSAMAQELTNAAAELRESVKKFKV